MNKYESVYGWENEWINEWAKLREWIDELMNELKFSISTLQLSINSACVVVLYLDCNTDKC